MEEAALHSGAGASEVSPAGNSDTAEDNAQPEVRSDTEEESIYLSGEAILDFEPVRVVSSQDSSWESHKRLQKPKLATSRGRHGLTFSSPPHVPREPPLPRAEDGCIAQLLCHSGIRARHMQARPPRKTNFTHTPDQLWHIAAENQRTVKRLMDISHRRSEWVGVQESKVFVPKLSGTARRRREAQLRLEQSNAWLQKRLQAIDASAGRAYSPVRAHSPSARQKMHRDAGLSPADHWRLQQGAPTTGGSGLWSSSIAAVHGSGSFQQIEVGATDQTLRLGRGSPVPGLNLDGIKSAAAEPSGDERLLQNQQMALFSD